MGISSSSPLLAEAKVYEQVKERLNVCAVSDTCARTIASWWQAPTNRALTALASGLHADSEDIVSEAMREIDALESPNIDKLCLLSLIYWAEHND